MKAIKWTRFRWRVVMTVARLLRVRMYSHWSENPDYMFLTDEEIEEEYDSQTT